HHCSPQGPFCWDWWDEAGAPLSVSRIVTWWYVVKDSGDTNSIVSKQGKLLGMPS
ncbi:unnamed protein product, partial [Gulo gulo]